MRWKLGYKYNSEVGVWLKYPIRVQCANAEFILHENEIIENKFVLFNSVNGDHRHVGQFDEWPAISVECLNGDIVFNNDITDISANYDNPCMTIPSGAFRNNVKLTSIYLPKTTTIGISAFNGCSNLESAYLNEVTTIKSNAFGGCSKLKEIVLNDLTACYDRAFAGCESLTAIYM